MKVYLYDVFHRCDSLTGWTPSLCSLALSSTQKIEGEYSIKMTSAANQWGVMTYSRTVDWSEFDHVIFSVYHPGWTNENGSIRLQTDAANWSSWSFYFAASWTEITIDLSSTPTSSLGTLDLSNITSIRIEEANLEDPGEDYYFDFFRGRSIDVTGNITYVKVIEEMGTPSSAELKIKGESLEHFNAGLEMEIHDSSDALSWRGRILYPEGVMEGTEVIGEITAIGSDSEFSRTYRKNFSVARDSDYIIKDVIDNALIKYHSYDDEIDNFALTSKYDLKTNFFKMAKYLRMLERAVIHYKPDGEIFFNKYNNLTASGKSWNQNTSQVRITSYTPIANRYVTRAPVIGANNSLGQVYYVGEASDALKQKYAINELQPWRDPEITNYTEAKQLGDNLLALYSLDTQMISMLTVGKGHLQVGYTIELAWTGVFSITQAHFLLTKRVWYPMTDICEINLTDNILTRKDFNIKVINKFYDEDAQQSYEEPDVSESTVAGTVESLHSVAELRSPSYFDAEAVDAMGAKADGNPLHHDKMLSYDDLTDKPSINDFHLLGCRGEDGFVEHSSYGFNFKVAVADASAYVDWSYYIKNAGSYSIQILYSTDTTTTGNASGVLYCSNSCPPVAMSWNKLSAVNCDLPLGTGGRLYRKTYGNVDLVANSTLGLLWIKDASCGGTTLRIYGLIIVKN